MRERGYGRIVNISSIIAQTGNIGQANYAAAKAGMIGLTKTLALESAKYDITVNAVCPGFIETDMLRDVPDAVREQIVARIPKQRFGTPEEVARVVRFLADAASGYVTGQQFNVNGGLHM
jgi:acetoacetyl-CoA reductase